MGAPRRSGAHPAAEALLREPISQLFRNFPRWFQDQSTICVPGVLGTRDLAMLVQSCSCALPPGVLQLQDGWHREEHELEATGPPEVYAGRCELLAAPPARPWGNAAAFQMLEQAPLPLPRSSFWGCLQALARKRCISKPCITQSWQLEGAHGSSVREQTPHSSCMLCMGTSPAQPCSVSRRCQHRQATGSPQTPP